MQPDLVLPGVFFPSIFAQLRALRGIGHILGPPFGHICGRTLVYIMRTPLQR